MKGVLALLALFVFAGPSVSYFKYQRPVQSSAAGQHYAVVDDKIWEHARGDLGDLRLYSGQNETPYALTVERGALHSESRDVRVLQPGRIGGKTQFFLDMAGLSEYDHVDIKLATKDYVAHARIEGHDDIHAPRWTDLGGTIFYDLSHESLGGNSTLRLPLTTYKFLRVTIDGPVQPKDVQGASASVREEEKAVWRDLSNGMDQTQQGKDTVLTFAIMPNVPIERIVFAIDPSQPNFRRPVEIQNDKKQWLGSGELSRIHMTRLGQKIDSEQSDIELSAVGQSIIKIIIHNGDDRPLKITEARLQQLERRIYFDAGSQASAPTLYYGDEKLGGPEYDYAKLFQKDAKAAGAQLGPEIWNTAYTGRPDERPWSEKHPAVLWAAIIAAVVVLGAIAIRSLKAMPAEKA